jgi:hypothetical protein
VAPLKYKRGLILRNSLSLLLFSSHQPLSLLQLDETAPAHTATAMKWLRDVPATSAFAPTQSKSGLRQRTLSDAHCLETPGMR